MTETWKPVVGFEGQFEVSDLGRVRRLYDKGRDGWMILKQQTHGSCRTYKVVNLSRLGARATGRRRRKGDKKPAGSSRYCKVHRLVLEAFVGPCPPGHQGLHRDDDGFNNQLSNLRWGTSAENGEDMKRNGNRKGEKNGRAKLTDVASAEVGRRRLAGESREILSLEFGISAVRVSQIAKAYQMAA